VTGLVVCLVSIFLVFLIVQASFGGTRIAPAGGTGRAIKSRQILSGGADVVGKIDHFHVSA